MRYMLLIYADERNSITQEEREDCYVKSAQLACDLHASGNFLAASPLHLTSTATSVRMRDSKRLVTDGPFAETGTTGRLFPDQRGESGRGNQYRLACPRGEVGHC